MKAEGVRSEKEGRRIKKERKEGGSERARDRERERQTLGLRY
jgi:hypothetical protein